jgi:uncharacterized protein (DUF1778 family)
MPRVGRPKLPKGKTQQKSILFRLTKEENRLIEAAVRRTAHKNKSRFIRDAALQAARAVTASEPNKPPI